MMNDERMMNAEQAMEATGFFGGLLEILAGATGSGMCASRPETVAFDVCDGVRYMIRRVGSWYCAYIEVPMDTDTPNFKCPWGVTWGDYFEDDIPSTEWPDGTPAKDGLKVIGWDYNHTSLDGGPYTMEEVMEDIRECIGRLKGGAADE